MALKPCPLHMHAAYIDLYGLKDIIPFMDLI